MQDSTFIKMAYDLAEESKCIARKVGACLVRNTIPLAFGVNGTPKGFTNCNAGGCSRCNSSSHESGQALDKCLCLHAEANCIYNLAGSTQHCQGATLYSTVQPCLQCLSMLVHVGIKRIIYSTPYTMSGDYYNLVEMLEEFKWVSL